MPRATLRLLRSNVHRLRAAAKGLPGRQVSGGAAILDLTARSGVLALRRALDCRTRRKQDPSATRWSKEDGVPDDEHKAGAVAAGPRRRCALGGRAATRPFRRRRVL